MSPIDNNVSIRQTRSEPEQGSTRSEQVRPGGPGGNRAVTPTAAGESVSLTRTAEELRSLETRLRELPGFDSARVESLRAAIASGSYQVDAAQVVDNLLQSERDFS